MQSRRAGGVEELTRFTAIAVAFAPKLLLHPSLASATTRSSSSSTLTSVTPRRAAACVRLTRRAYSTTPPKRSISSFTAELPRPSTSYLPWAAGATALVLGTAYLASDTSSSAFPIASTSALRRTNDDPLSIFDAQTLSTQSSHLRHLPLSRLIKSYIVYLVSSSQLLVDSAPTIISSFSVLRDHVPLIGPLAWSTLSFILRETFFEQFAGGETAAECLRVIERLRSTGVGAMLSYSVEAEQHEGETSKDMMIKTAQHHMQETLTAIRVAGNFAPNHATLKPTWVAIKGTFTWCVFAGSTCTNFLRSSLPPVTGLVPDPTLLERASLALAGQSHDTPPTLPTLNPDDAERFEELYEGLRSCCKIAKQAGVRVVLDAEQSWYQPS